MPTAFILRNPEGNASFVFIYDGGVGRKLRVSIPSGTAVTIRAELPATELRRLAAAGIQVTARVAEDATVVRIRRQDAVLAELNRQLNAVTESLTKPGDPSPASDLATQVSVLEEQMDNPQWSEVRVYSGNLYLKNITTGKWHALSVAGDADEEHIRIHQGVVL